MKSAVVGTKDWNIAECMSAARYVEYTEEDFKDIDVFSDGICFLHTNDVTNMCRQIVRCPVIKCNLKKALVEHRELIMENIKAKQRKEAKHLLNQVAKQFNHIKTTTKGK